MVIITAKIIIIILRSFLFSNVMKRIKKWNDLQVLSPEGPTNQLFNQHLVIMKELMNVGK